MAIIDPDRNLVIVRIVYDGPPLSGKTTTVKALQSTLAKTGDVFTPEERAGQTQFFDWLDYEGGTFGGRPIACQIVSVPGQPSLRQRREHLLASADAVVFVADARPAELSAGLLYYQQLQELLAARQEIPAQIIVQANKQDLPGAMNEGSLSLFFPDETKITESTAAESRGIRETFVFAVRLALDRLKQHMDSGKQVMAAMDDAPGEALLAELQAMPLTPANSDEVLNQVLDTQPVQAGPPPPATATPATTPPASLDQATPPAHPTQVWPAFLAAPWVEQLAQAQLDAEELPHAWHFRDATLGWHCWTKPEWRFASNDDAKLALRDHIRDQLRYAPILTEKRFLAVTESSEGWRVWQVSQADQNAAHRVEQALAEPDPATAARELESCAQWLDQALLVFAGYHPPIPALTLDSVAEENQAPVYAGLLAEGEQATWKNRPAAIASLIAPAVQAKDDETLCAALEQLDSPWLADIFSPR